MSIFLKVENINCGYLGGFMLQDINFEVKKGSFTGIIGPNGSGKTTLFKGITGDIDLVGGGIFLQETNILNLDIKQKAQKIAVVSQSIDVADITVEDYVLMGRLPFRNLFQFIESKKDYEIANKYIEFVGIQKYKDKLMSEISGGEQQLAAIARALTQEPEILLLDEPTSHLDISHQIQILNLIQQLNENKKLTVLMIIHDLNLASEYCDYLVMMNNGEVYVQGTPEKVLNYKHIEEVYKTVVVTQENPLSKKPVMFLVSGKTLRSLRK